MGSVLALRRLELNDQPVDLAPRPRHAPCTLLGAAAAEPIKIVRWISRATTCAELLDVPSRTPSRGGSTRASAASSLESFDLSVVGNSPEAYARTLAGGLRLRTVRSASSSPAGAGCDLAAVRCAATAAALATRLALSARTARISSSSVGPQASSLGRSRVSAMPRSAAPAARFGPTVPVVRPLSTPRAVTASSTTPARHHQALRAPQHRDGRLRPPRPGQADRQARDPRSEAPVRPSLSRARSMIRSSARGALDS